jgi:hypothetical protein
LQGGLHHFRPIAIGEYDVWIFATQLKRKLFKHGGCYGSDPLSCPCTPGERNSFYVRMLNDSFTRCFSPAMNNIQNAVGKPCNLTYPGE